ncbi:hypothetical protein V8C26DRAFT_192938 [Trichoderma gracile]
MEGNHPGCPLSVSLPLSFILDYLPYLPYLRCSYMNFALVLFVQLLPSSLRLACPFAGRRRLSAVLVQLWLWRSSEMQLSRLYQPVGGHSCFCSSAVAGHGIDSGLVVESLLSAVRLRAEYEKNMVTHTSACVRTTYCAYSPTCRPTYSRSYKHEMRAWDIVQEERPAAQLGPSSSPWEAARPPTRPGLGLAEPVRRDSRDSRPRPCCDPAPSTSWPSFQRFVTAACFVPCFVSHSGVALHPELAAWSSTLERGFLGIVDPGRAMEPPAARNGPVNKVPGQYLPTQQQPGCDNFRKQMTLFWSCPVRSGSGLLLSVGLPLQPLYMIMGTHETMRSGRLTPPTSRRRRR